MRLLFFCKYSPLIENLIVVPPEPVYALDYERVSRFYPLHQAFVARSVEILSRLLVDDNELFVHAAFAQGD